MKPEIRTLYDGDIVELLVGVYMRAVYHKNAPSKVVLEALLSGLEKEGYAELYSFVCTRILSEKKVEVNTLTPAWSNRYAIGVLNDILNGTPLFRPEYEEDCTVSKVRFVDVWRRESELIEEDDFEDRRNQFCNQWIPRPLSWTESAGSFGCRRVKPVIPE